jgi:hypothetical protein
MKASGQRLLGKRLMRFSDGEWGCLLRGCFPGSSITSDFFFNFMRTSWLTIALLASTVICTQAQDASTPPWQDTDIGAAPQAGGKRCPNVLSPPAISGRAQVLLSDESVIFQSIENSEFFQKLPNNRLLNLRTITTKNNNIK